MHIKTQNHLSSLFGARTNSLTASPMETCEKMLRDRYGSVSRMQDKGEGARAYTLDTKCYILEPSDHLLPPLSPKPIDATSAAAAAPSGLFSPSRDKYFLFNHCSRAIAGKSERSGGVFESLAKRAISPSPEIGGPHFTKVADNFSSVDASHPT